MTHPANRLSLVADIGGTNTRCALAEDGRVLAQTVRRYANAENAGLAEVIARYLADEGGADPAAACVAVAGPVRDGKASLTNLDWQIDLATLSQAARAERVAIINDLQAQGHALGHIAPEHLRTILPFAQAPAGATGLVIGVGTGFNAAPVFAAPGGRLVAPSESGHVNLPVRSETDARLAAFLTAAHGFASVEDVLSGRGIENTYAWAAAEAGRSPTLTGRQIMAALEDADPVAITAARMLVRMLGMVAGNLALIQLPFGGIFLVGGVSRALAPWFDELGFAEAFRDKGRFGPFMSSFGVAVVEDDYAALTGCAAYLKGAD